MEGGTVFRRGHDCPTMGQGSWDILIRTIHTNLSFTMTCHEGLIRGSSVRVTNANSHNMAECGVQTLCLPSAPSSISLPNPGTAPPWVPRVPSNHVRNVDDGRGHACRSGPNSLNRSWERESFTGYRAVFVDNNSSTDDTSSLVFAAWAAWSFRSKLHKTAFAADSATTCFLFLLGDAWVDLVRI